jgi:acetyl esterase
MPMIPAAILAALAGLIAVLLCATPRGFVSPPTGFLLRLSALLARIEPVPREVAARRRKNDGDALIVSSAPTVRLSVEDRSIPGPGGPIPLRLYGPIEGEPTALLLFIHGGGWVLGGIESADPTCRSLCLESGALVLSIDYRLAPEHPFPAAVVDVLTAYEWILGEMAASRILPRGVFVAGDSAGGNLAAALCLLARERALAPPAGQILFYPVTDISRTDGPSYELFAKGFLLDRGDMEWFISLYAPDPSQRKDPRASPLLAPDLAGLPPALILTAAFDVLRDEGEAYAAALRAAGVDAESRRMRGLVHGFLSMSRFVPSARRCARMAASFMREKSGGL